MAICSYTYDGNGNQLTITDIPERHRTYDTEPVTSKTVQHWNSMV